MRFAPKGCCTDSQAERPGFDKVRSLLPWALLGLFGMVEQTALNHLLPEEACFSQEGLKLAPDKAACPVWPPIRTFPAGPAVDAAEFKGTASLGPTSRTGMRKGSSDLPIVKDGTTFVLQALRGGVDFSCHYCVFMHWM